MIPEPTYESAEQPKGRDQEAALVGAVLRRPAIFAEIRAMVKPEQFDFFCYRAVWEAIDRLATADQGIDTLTVGDELDRKGHLADFATHDRPGSTGRIALSYLRDEGQPQNAKDYAANVADYAAKRELQAIASKLAYWSANGRRAHDIIGDVEKMIAAVNTGSTISKSTVTMKEAIRQAYDRTDAAYHGEVTYIPSGFRDLDEVITGFSSPDLTIIAGRPGMGKTALLCSIAKNIVEQQHKKVSIFSLEMASRQVAMRFISMDTGISYKAQLTGKLRDEEWPVYNQAVEKLGDNDYGVSINDMPAISPNKIRQELHRQGDVDVVMVDYLQLAAADGKFDNRFLAVGSVARELKNICKEFNIPLVVAAQLSREGDRRNSGDKSPIMSDLGESGEIERAADNIIFIHRPTDKGDVSDIIIAKQRNGPAPMTCNLKYVGYKTRFENY